MKYKHEKTIRNMSMLALPIILILGKLGKVKIQITLGIISFVICTAFGIYCIYRGLKLAGTVFLCISVGLIFVFLSCYYNSYNLAVPIPGVFAVALILSYKVIEMSDDKEKIIRIKKEAVIGITLFLIAQILMIALLFIKH